MSNLRKDGNPPTESGAGSRARFRSRRRHSKRRAQRIARWRFLSLTALFVCGLAACSVFLQRAAERSESARHPGASADAPLDVARSPDRPRGKRRQYRYSVIPKGAYTAEELRDAIAADPVVAAHYVGFDARRARVVRLARARRAYVSYRLIDRIYWTRIPVSVAAGEEVLTDGPLMARARCGNRLSEVPGETSPDEPPQTLLDTPLDALVLPNGPGPAPRLRDPSIPSGALVSVAPELPPGAIRERDRPEGGPEIPKERPWPPPPTDEVDAEDDDDVTEQTERSVPEPGLMLLMAAAGTAALTLRRARLR